MALTNNFKSVVQSLREQNNTKYAPQNMRKAAHRIGALLQGKMVLRNRRVLKVRTGSLLNSIQYKIAQADKGGMTVSAGSFGVKYARIHEFGGTIRPVRAKALKFFYRGSWHTVQAVRIPKRPYIMPGFMDAKTRVIEILRSL